MVYWRECVRIDWICKVWKKWVGMEDSVTIYKSGSGRISITFRAFYTKTRFGGYSFLNPITTNVTYPGYTVGFQT